ncbi:NACHT domain-containing protein [Roseofilum sp. Guam]|uniref:NACHT domain-containing protein n=1 Tax=Roseofilum sp. Guam TaxID=2821502 RepID=UPI001B2B71A1|nr:NACHT domain-containing protein [Roseofilum sp. Guam]MBP0029245.1 NACHT domain-containing protein [Roseofilum sp. Guam]
MNWQDISSFDLPSDTSSDQSSSQVQVDEDLIEQVKERCRQKILARHSRMRLLSGEEIGVDQLYVDVWLLGRPEYKYFNTLESLLSNFDIENDRLALSKRLERSPGFEVANSNSRLIILGKPGSGKTTFLKHLAVDWCKGKFQPNKIAVLIELRRIRDSEWDIGRVVGQELGLDDWDQIVALKKQIGERKKEYFAQLANKQKNTNIEEENHQKNKKKSEKIEQNIKNLKKQLKSIPLHYLLEQGKILILMDGLDEIPTHELRCDVQDQVHKLAEEYSKINQFILTCRTQIIEIIPCNFRLVEVADFSLEQVRKFVQNWFTANGKSEAEATKQWKKVNRAITNQPDLKEVTATPILLSLICVVLQDSGVIPTNRTDLYKRGINWLLNRWNDEKDIKTWEVGTEAYRQLSLEDKEILLIEIAARKFENPQNFVLFDQRDLAQKISQKLHLSNTREGVTVLKAIEAQHGLLIERADELWSFSHLTFQEYFTFQWLIKLPPQQLGEKIANQRWQEIVKQLVKSQQPADRLLRLIKYAIVIDQSIAQDPVIQSFFCSLLQRSKSLQTDYKPAAIRAFYYSLSLDLNHARNHHLKHSHNLDLNFDLNLACDLDLNLACDLDLNLARNLKLNLDGALDLDLNLVHAFTRAHTLDLDLAHVFARARARTLSFARAHSRARDLYQDLNQLITRALSITHTYTLDRNPSVDLIFHLSQLKNALPTSNHSEDIQGWWRLNGVQWIEQLRDIMIEYRNIGYDWQFTEEQRQQLRRYYQANKFLVNLMNIEGAVTEDCRTEIEQGLLLPWAELQRRYPHLYSDTR